MFSRATNNQLQAVRTVLRQRDRATPQFAVEGWKSVLDLLGSKWEVVSLFVEEEWVQSHPEQWAQLPEEKTFIIPKSGTQVSVLKTSPGIVALATTQWNSLESLLKKKAHILVCDGIADPGNLGTVLRTADWFGVTGILYAPGTVDPFNPKVVQASMGSITHLYHCDIPDLSRALTLMTEQGYTIVATVLGQDESTPALKGPLALVLGSESHGVSPVAIEAAHYRYTIPGKGKAESLNVGVATGIALFDLLSKSNA